MAWFLLINSLIEKTKFHGGFKIYGISYTTAIKTNKSDRLVSLWLGLPLAYSCEISMQFPGKSYFLRIHGLKSTMVRYRRYLMGSSIASSAVQAVHLFICVVKPAGRWVETRTGTCEREEIETCMFSCEEYWCALRNRCTPACLAHELLISRPLSLWICCWLAKTSHRPSSRTIWLKVTPCNLIWSAGQYNVYIRNTVALRSPKVSALNPKEWTMSEIKVDNHR